MSENKEPISRNGVRLYKDDVVRVLECCSCKGCTPFKGSLATITATQDEDEWLRMFMEEGEEPILRLKMVDGSRRRPGGLSRTCCCFRACNVDFVSREGGNNQVYIDHIYERVTQNATPGEIRILANRLHAFADAQ